MSSGASWFPPHQCYRLMPRRVERESSKLLHRSGYSWATVSETEVDCAATPLTVVVPVMGMV